MLALEGGYRIASSGPLAQVEAEVRRRFPGRGARILLARSHGGEVVLGPPSDAVAAAESLPNSLTQGGLAGSESALRALLQEGVRLDAAVLALVGAGPHDASADWIGRLLGPVLEGGFDYVRPIYLRPATEGTLSTGIVYPLTRALYGARLRQPIGGEVALSAALARRLLDDPDWRRDPGSAGSDAWLVAKVLAGRQRVCQAWLGAWPRQLAEPEDASRALARVLGPVFREMERHAERWQRVRGSEPVPAFGSGGDPSGEPSRVPVERLVDAFRLGQRDLGSVWGLVLPPGTMFGLRRAAGAVAGAFCIPDELWARVVYDFAVAHYAKTVERRQLLASMTPLYLGWIASFANEVRDLDAAAAEERVEELGKAFEREKPYLISRWRWPEGFNP